MNQPSFSNENLFEQNNEDLSPDRKSPQLAQDLHYSSVSQYLMRQDYTALRNSSNIKSKYLNENESKNVSPYKAEIVTTKPVSLFEMRTVRIKPEEA